MRSPSSSYSGELLRDAREFLTAPGGPVNSYLELPLAGAGLATANTAELEPLGTVMLFPNFGRTINHRLSIVSHTNAAHLKPASTLQNSLNLFIAASGEDIAKTTRYRMNHRYSHPAGGIATQDYCRTLGIPEAAIGYFATPDKTERAAKLYFPVQADPVEALHRVRAAAWLCQNKVGKLALEVVVPKHTIPSKYQPKHLARV